jgi:hypothetical protein
MKLFAFALAIGVVGVSSTVSADCLDAAIGAIEQKGITDWDRKDEPPILQEVTMVQDVIMGYRAWFHVARCEQGPGMVVVNMGTSCRVTDIWIKGECDSEIEQALSE